jgi:hypothetical protein
MVCLLCKNNLPLVRRIVQSNLPFCSEAHHVQFLAESSRRMIERLAVTRERYAAYRQAVITQPRNPAEAAVVARTMCLNPLEQTS